MAMRAEENADVQVHANPRLSWYSELKRLAKERGINVQELVRAVIIPGWMRTNQKQRAK